MTIDPSEFIKAKKAHEKEIGVEVTGTFVCQTCLEPVQSARLDEDEMVLVYVCREGHSSEATL